MDREEEGREGQAEERSGGQPLSQPLPQAGEEDGVAAGEPAPLGRIHPNKNRELQVARTGGRKLFDAERKQLFLEWFAATCNASLSAEMAGINYKTACKHYLSDPDFAAGWDQAVRLAVARLEAKQLETKKNKPRIGIEGDLDAPDMDDIDPALAIQLIREHRREIGNGRSKRGRPPRVATNAEVVEALVKRLAAFGVRVSSEACASGGREEAPPPPFGRSPSPGNPGEDCQ